MRSPGTAQPWRSPAGKKKTSRQPREILQSTGQRCIPIVADVRQSDEVNAAANRVVAELGSLDLLINNAAGNFFCPSANLSPNGFGTVIDIDAKGTWNASRAAYDAWQRDHGGQILNISADAALRRYARPVRMSPPPKRPSMRCARRLPSSGARRIYASTPSHQVRSVTPKVCAGFSPAKPPKSFGPSSQFAGWRN